MTDHPQPEDVHGYDRHRESLPTTLRRERCPDCGAFLAKCGLDDTTCANARCDSSWQAARRQFETSMLGAACRQMFGDKR